MKPLFVSSLVLGAGIAGFLGGVVAVRIFPREPARSAEIVRARSFELLDDRGEAVSYWGFDKNENLVLAFGGHWLDRPGGRRRLPGDPRLGLRDPVNQVVSLGVADDFPLLQFRGDDGKPRMMLDVSMYSKPMLVMDDETGPRLTLGVQQSDTPGPQDNDWALTFEPNRVWLGTTSLKADGRRYVQGFFTVDKNKIIYPPPAPK